MMGFHTGWYIYICKYEFLTKIINTLKVEFKVKTELKFLDNEN